MGRRFVDISMFLENDVVSDPPPMRPKITYMNHQTTVGQIASFFPGLKKEDLPDGEGWAVELVELITHHGTHLDAPYHFHSTMNGGERSSTIDEVPLEWCFQPAVKLDFRHLEDGHVVTVNEVERELDRIGHTLSPLEIVLVNTRAGSRYGKDDYVQSGCGMGYEATMYLLERGVRLTGTDAWSWDAPFVHTAARYRENHDPSIIWEGHKAGRKIGYCHLEKLHNLEALPPFGFVVSCFPVQDPGCIRGLDACGRHFRLMTAGSELLLAEGITEDGEAETTHLCLVDGVLHLRVGSVYAGGGLPIEALDAVMKRYGRPLEAEIDADGPSLPLPGGRVLTRMRHRARYDVIAKDFLVYRVPNAEPLAELAVSVTAALLHLARAPRG